MSLVDKFKNAKHFVLYIILIFFLYMYINSITVHNNFTKKKKTFLNSCDSCVFLKHLILLNFDGNL